MTTTCTLAIHQTNAGYLFRVIGSGTKQHSPAVRDFIAGAMEDGVEVVLDLSECEYLDSTFLGCLVILHRSSKSLPGAFIVLADEAAETRLLEAMQLHRVLEIRDQRPDCVGEEVILEVSSLERGEFCRHLIEAHLELAELGGPSAETFRRIAEQLAQELNTPSS